jgi:Zn-dependent oligopeptidase
MTTSLKNPLLDYGEFAPYEQIKPDHIVPAIKEGITRARKNLAEVLKLLDDDSSELFFNNTLFPLIEIDADLDRAWTPIQNLLSLAGTKEVRDAANEARPLIVEFYNEYSLDPRVYSLVKKYSETTEAKNLTGEKARHLRNTLLGFKLAGAELNDSDKEEFKKLNLELSELSRKFSDNVTDSKFELVVLDASDLSGLSEDIIAAAKDKADEYRSELGIEKVPESAWIFNLDYPSYGPFMKFADNGALRKKMYFEYLNKGTAKDSQGLLAKGETLDLNNEEIVSKIFQAKLRKAQLLGYKSYAEVSLETKMAPSPHEVKVFLERLATKAKPLALKEYAELVEFQKKIGYANTENNPEKIYPWDKEYLSEKLRKAKYDFDTNLTKPYFELYACINGMFDIAKTLFGVNFKKITGVEVWHKDVEVYQVENLDGSRIGTFYMDLYPRDIKKQGAWVMPIEPACINMDGSKSLPQCTLTCNLTKPTKDQPSLLNHLELTTLFHEFGHALHHLLSKVELAPLSGTDVEWDFVELPSQLNENFCWESESLRTFAKHYKSGEVIPDSLLDKMLKARNFNEGLACIRQLEFGLFDLAVYMQEDIKLAKPANEIFKSIVSEYGVFDFIESTNFPCSFSHIFAGGYSAGYYSYKWAEVLEADAFSRFQKEGVLNPKVGSDYRTAILERGDSKAPMELFVEFMGREPNENALLERMGLANV